MPAQLPDVQWIELAGNPWGVRLLDVRPVTQHMLSTSSDPQCAANAVSFGGDDGSSFIGQEPPDPRTAKVNLSYRIGGTLKDGVLFTPTAMEHKWALFYHRRQILCVRSWRRKVFAVAETEERENSIVISQIRGVLCAEQEEPEFTARVLDFLLRSHALDLVYPVPLLPGLEQDPGKAALWCLSCFGNRAQFATSEILAREVPEKALHTR